MAVTASCLGEAHGLRCRRTLASAARDRQPTDLIDGPGDRSAVSRSLAPRSFSHAFSRNLDVRGAWRSS